MLSAVINEEYSYPALRLMTQPAHQGFLHPGPLVLWTTPIKTRTIPLDRVRHNCFKFLDPGRGDRKNLKSP